MTFNNEDTKQNDNQHNKNAECHYSECRDTRKKEGKKFAPIKFFQLLVIFNPIFISFY